MSGRGNRRGIGGGGVIVTPKTILGASLLQWVRADLGIELNGSNVSAWADQSGNGHHYAQGTAGNQPPYEATGGPNGTPAVSGDGTDYLTNATLDLPAPATTNTTIWIICRVDTWVSADTLIASPGGAFNSGLSLTHQTSTPRIYLTNESLGPFTGGLALGTWGCIEALFTGSTAGNTDQLRLNDGAPATGNGGNVDPTIGRALFGRTTGAQLIDAAIAECVHVNRALTAQERTDLGAYRLRRYGF